MTWRDVSVRNIIPEPLSGICEHPSSSPSNNPTPTPTSSPQTNAPTPAPQTDSPTTAPQTSSLSAKPSSTPTLAWSEEPSVELSQLPSQHPTHFPVVEASQNPSSAISQVPSELSSTLPSSLLQVVSINATTDVLFPGIEEKMTASEVTLFEKTTAEWLQNTSNVTWLEIKSVEIVEQAVVFSTIPSPGTRNLRRSQMAQGMTALTVAMLVTAEATFEKGDDVPSLSTLGGVVEDAINSDSGALRDDLSQVLSLFIVEEPPFDGRGGNDDDDINDEEASDNRVGAIFGSVLVAMLFVLTVVVAVFYRRTRCTKMPLAEVQDDIDEHLYPAQRLAPREGSDKLIGDDADSVGSGVSMSDFSELYAMSSVGLSADAGGGDGIGIDPPVTATANQNIENLIPPSSIAHYLYPIISVSESGESTSNNGSDEVAGANGDKVSAAAVGLKDDDSYARMQAHQKKAIEMLLDQSEISDDGKSLDTAVDSGEEEDDVDDDEETGAATTEKGSPIKTMFRCFQPEPPLDGEIPSMLTSSPMISVGSASPPQSAKRPVEKYEIRAPAGSLGMVVVTSREGPRVYHVKNESALANVIEEGDIIVDIDGQNTRHMTATAVRRFLRSRDAQTERVITIRGRRRATETESSSGEYLL